MVNQNLTPNEFIKLLRKGSPNEFREIYISGACYKLYELLKYIFPNAKAYFTKERNHIITKIDDDFYDINGKVRSRYLYSGKYDNLELTTKDHTECKKWNIYK